MKAAAQTTFAERMGRTLGRLWRGSARQDQQASRWLVARGMPSGMAKALLVAFKVIALGVLLYIAFWLVLLLACVALGAWAIRHSGTAEPEEWAIGDQADHKRSPFYDPINYNDDPDPRF